jgi:hypothetical protein
MIPLEIRDEQAIGPPPLRIPRVVSDGQFEPRGGIPVSATAFAAAYVDTGAPYVIIPYKVHRSGLIRVHTNRGLQPYGILSGSGGSLLQPFAEVGIRFLIQRPKPDYRPAQYAIVRAYLLEPGIRPTERVVIGLDAIQTYFPLYAEGKRAFFLEPGDSLTVP